MQESTAGSRGIVDCEAAQLELVPFVCASIGAAFLYRSCYIQFPIHHPPGTPGRYLHRNIMVRTDNVNSENVFDNIYSEATCITMYQFAEYSPSETQTSLICWFIQHTGPMWLCTSTSEHQTQIKWTGVCVHPSSWSIAATSVVRHSQRIHLTPLTRLHRSAHTHAILMGSLSLLALLGVLWRFWSHFRVCCNAVHAINMSAHLAKSSSALPTVHQNSVSIGKSCGLDQTLITTSIK